MAGQAREEGGSRKWALAGDASQRTCPLFCTSQARTWLSQDVATKRFAFGLNASEETPSVIGGFTCARETNPPTRYQRP